jgi:hypothetical protein
MSKLEELLQNGLRNNVSGATLRFWKFLPGSEELARRIGYCSALMSCSIAMFWIPVSLCPYLEDLLSGKEEA